MGHSGGILAGIKDDVLEVEKWNKGNFFVETEIRDRLLNLRWSFVVVYGPANHGLSVSFIGELQ